MRASNFVCEATMNQRTEDQIISKAPIKRTLGEVQYDFAPLTIVKARQWREKVNNIMQDVVATMDPNPENDTGKSIGSAITAALIAYPEKVADAVFAWSSDLPREKIEAEATEEQIAAAFSAIMVMAYPFLAPLVLTMKVTKSR